VAVAWSGLRDPSAKVRNAAVLAAVFLGHPTLIGALAELLRDKPVRDQVEAVFNDATGQPIPYPSKNMDSVLGRVVSSMDADRRYFSGVLWTLQAMTRTLVTPVSDYFGSGNLMSATGRDFGYDPNRDLIYNLGAIEQYESFADEQASEFPPGYWYYQGQR